MKRPALTIRPAKPTDVGLILSLIRELAEFTKSLKHVKATKAGLKAALFGKRSTVEALVALEGRDPVGFALYFHNFSTFLGKRGLHLEDLYVRPAFRSKGYGKLLLSELARLALDRDCGRLEWNVLNWNERAISFYKGLGAKALDDWSTFRLDLKGIRALAAKAPRRKPGPRR